MSSTGAELAAALSVTFDRRGETVDPNKPVEYMGKEASADNTKLLKSGPLRLDLDVQERDQYGRLLAYVWAGDVFINQQLVLDGYAQVATYPPDVEVEDVFVAAQQQARDDTGRASGPRPPRRRTRTRRPPPWRMTMAEVEAPAGARSSTSPRAARSTTGPDAST